VSKRAYVPERGDVIHLNLSGTAGRVFDGPHFSLVISKIEFQRATGLCIILPTTSKHHPELGALIEKLPRLPGLNKDGWVLIHHVRAIDFRERSIEFATKLELDNPNQEQFLNDIIDRLFGIVDEMASP
jgi:mRNA-degrading endonuclease toxin of MazEF toxin-antitoxin module